jgi:uncharacterized membrane protein
MIRWRSLGALAPRLILSGIFALSGILKVLDPAVFQSAVDGYRLLPYPATAVVALVLPWVEILAAAGLWLRRYRVAALLLIAGLLLVFVAALTSVPLRGLVLEDCGCFGPWSRGGSVRWVLLQDLVLLALVGWVLAQERHRPSPVVSHGMRTTL